MEGLKRRGFHSVRTFEVRLKEYYANRVCLEPPPKRRLVGKPDDKTGDHRLTLPTDDDAKKRTLTCARPFQVMRGHTAFLTFATAGLRDALDPKKEDA